MNGAREVRLREVRRPPAVTLECPECGSKRSVPRMGSDLPGTVRVVAACPQCDPDNKRRTVRYFNGMGREIGKPRDTPK